MNLIWRSGACLTPSIRPCHLFRAAASRMVGQYKGTAASSSSLTDDAAPNVDRPMFESPPSAEIDDDDDSSSAGPGPGPGSLASSAATPWGARQALDPGLYLVATPIGNLQDITLRALSVLRSASLVLAEDTRHTGKLLAAFGIRTTMASYHSHNEKERTWQVVARLKEGESLALVSDAGMPGISDPGYVLVQAAIEAGVKVFPVPGACALVAAVVASGLATDSFTFCGFLPPKQGARQARLEQLSVLASTLIFYAPPHGLRAVLGDMVQVLGPARRACVARELTKLHEEFYRSTLQGALEEFTRREPRGEMCIVVQGCDPASARMEALLRGLDGGDGNPNMASANAVPASTLDGDSEQGNGSESVLEASDGASSTAASRGEASTQGVSPALSGVALLGPVRLEALLLRLLQSGLPTKEVAKEASRLVPGLGRKEAYAAALKLSQRQKLPRT